MKGDSSSCSAQTANASQLTGGTLAVPHPPPDAVTGLTIAAVGGAAHDLAHSLSV